MSNPEFNYERTLQACAAGNREALRDLYAQEAGRMFTVVYRILQNRAIAEEIVHDAFMKIWSNASSFQTNLGSARGWIYTLTRNLALNSLEKSQRQVQSDPERLNDLLDNLQTQETQNESPMESQLEHDHLLRCLETLNAESKQCILHAYVEGYSQQEISSLMDKPLGTIKSWIRRSLQSLKECLE